MTDMEHKLNKIKTLTAGNERSYGELVEATQGRFSMDTSDYRRELFINKLVEWGIITDEQKADYDLAFLEEVETQLDNAWKQFREAQEKAVAGRLLLPQQQAPVLTDAQGRPLRT